MRMNEMHYHSTPELSDFDQLFLLSLIGPFLVLTVLSWKKYLKGE